MLKIVSEKNGTTHLYQDGKEIHGIKSLSFSHDAMTDGLMMLTILSMSMMFRKCLRNRLETQTLKCALCRYI